MVVFYYESLMALSVVMLVIYNIVYRKSFNIFFTLIFTFIPVALYGYYLMATAEDLPTALMGQKIIYFGGTFTPLFILFVILNLCKVSLKQWMKTGLLVLTLLTFFSVMSIGKKDWYYKSVSFKRVDLGAFGSYGSLDKVYGPMHTVFYAVVFFLFLLAILATIYGSRKKAEVSGSIVRLLAVTVGVTVFAFFVGRKLIDAFDPVPLSYVVSEVLYLLIIHRVMLYDIVETGVSSIENRGEMGLVSFDMKFNYLGSNERAKEVFPELRNLNLDGWALEQKSLGGELGYRIVSFEEDRTKNVFYREVGDRVYQVQIVDLVDSKRQRGFQLIITDNTEEQKYISLLNKFNDKLQQEVDQKTKHIVEMHDNLILSMATMVESRDNSTGGHIRRTSDVVRILIDEIKAQGDMNLTDEFCENMIKAAPMHDLGKIAVDDAILRKPGRFTDEEFEKMKAHAAEGGRIVHEILKNTDDHAFHLLAENVARYHHERWDGSGYPEGLKGEEIPLEARIMAVADVYDALVSKRVYKERMSFEQADKIIMESMGKHFDARLEKYYVAARPRLEAYYSEQEGS